MGCERGPWSQEAVGILSRRLDHLRRSQKYQEGKIPNAAQHPSLCQQGRRSENGETHAGQRGWRRASGKRLELDGMKLSWGGEGGRIWSPVSPTCPTTHAGGRHCSGHSAQNQGQRPVRKCWVWICCWCPPLSVHLNFQGRLLKNVDAWVSPTLTPRHLITVVQVGLKHPYFLKLLLSSGFGEALGTSVRTWGLNSGVRPWLGYLG